MLINFFSAKQGGREGEKEEREEGIRRKTFEGRKGKERRVREGEGRKNGRNHEIGRQELEGRN